MNNKTNIEDYLKHSIEEIRSELSPYCLNNCNSSCCDLTGTDIMGIIVTKKELKAMVGDIFERIKLIREKYIVRKEQGLYRLQYIACPSYDSGTKKCLIHNNPIRPNACSEFPIFFFEPEENGKKPEVNMDGRCQYIRQNWHTIVDKWESENPELHDEIDIRMIAFFGTIHGYEDIYIKETNKEKVNGRIKELIQYHEYDD